MSVPPIRNSSDSQKAYSSGKGPEGNSEWMGTLDSFLRLEINKKLKEAVVRFTQVDSAKTVFTEVDMTSTIQNATINETLSSMSQEQAQDLLKYLQDVLPQTGEDVVKELLRLLTEKSLSPPERIKNVENFIHGNTEI